MQWWVLCNAMLGIVQCSVGYCAMQCWVLCNAMLGIDFGNEAFSGFFKTEINIKPILNHFLNQSINQEPLKRKIQILTD